MATAGVRAVLKRANSWASGRPYQRSLSVLGVVCFSPILDVPLPFFNPACRHCFSQSMGLDHPQLTPVPCAKDDKGVLFAANYVVGAYNDCRYGATLSVYSSVPRFRLLRVEESSVIRIGLLSIYSLLLEGITETGDLNMYRAVVLYDPLQQLADLIDCELVSESPFPFIRRYGLPRQNLEHLETRRHLLDLIKSEGLMDRSMQWEPKSNLGSTVARGVFVPVDTEDNEQIYKYALSAVEVHNNQPVEKYLYREKVNPILLEKVLCAGKLKVACGFRYLLLFRAKDGSEDSSTYCAIVNERGCTEFFSKSLREYEAYASETI